MWSNGNVDIFLITQTAIALDDYKTLEIEKQSVRDTEERKALRKEQDMLAKQNKSNFTELGLSPASRSRLASMQLQRQEEAKDPLTEALIELRG